MLLKNNPDLPAERLRCRSAQIPTGGREPATRTGSQGAAETRKGQSGQIPAVLTKWAAERDLQHGHYRATW